MAIRNKFAPVALACVLGTGLAGLSAPVLSSDAGAFIGGVFATKLIGGVRENTEAQEQAAAQRPVPAVPAQKSPEQRIAELDKLAAGGYITPEEYKAKKQKIVDGMRAHPDVGIAGGRWSPAESHHTRPGAAGRR